MNTSNLSEKESIGTFPYWEKEYVIYDPNWNFNKQVTCGRIPVLPVYCEIQFGVVRVDQGILKVESGLFQTPVLKLCYGVTAILTVTYGGELLYLWIWCDHLVWLHKLSLLCVLPYDNLIACVI